LPKLKLEKRLMNSIHRNPSSFVLATIVKRFSAVASVALLLGLATTVPAATITSGGHAYDVGLGMSPYDQGGYIFFGTSPANTSIGGGFTFNTSPTSNTVAMPSFVSSISAVGLTTIAEGFSYTNIKPTASGPTIESGVAYLGGVSTGTEYPLLDINFANTPQPSTVRVGILVNNEAAWDQSPNALRLENVSNPTDTISLAVSHAFSGSQPQAGNDIYFFNVSPTPGSTYELFGTAGPSPLGNLTISGVMFTPEPGAFGMMGAGAVGLLAMVRAARRRGV
jgi:hypothetical protein